MTIQEIIHALRRLQVETGSLACLGCTHENSCSTKGCAVIRAAMESLEGTQTAGDCISRQDAIDRFMPYVHMDEKVPAETVIEELHMFPAVGMQEEQQWIPCSERLPKEKQRVIVRCATVGTTVGWILWGEWMTDLGRGCADVTHWMPLPQPPKEVQGNGCAILRQAAEELEQLPAPEPLTPAQVKVMDYDKVWIDYGNDGEWGIIVEGLLYSISTLEGAGFVDMLQDAVVRGEDIERPSGSYQLYRTQRIYEEESHAETD